VECVVVCFKQLGFVAAKNTEVVTSPHIACLQLQPTASSSSSSLPYNIIASHNIAIIIKPILLSLTHYWLFTYTPLTASSEVHHATCGALTANMFQLTPVQPDQPLPSQCWVQKPAAGLPQDPTCYTLTWQPDPLNYAIILPLAFLPLVLALLLHHFIRELDPVKRYHRIRAGYYGAIGWFVTVSVPMLMRDVEARGMKRPWRVEGLEWLSPNVVSALGMVVHLGFVILQIVRTKNEPCTRCGSMKKTAWESFCGECKVEKANVTGLEVQEKEKSSEEKGQLLDVV